MWLRQEHRNKIYIDLRAARADSDSRRQQLVASQRVATQLQTPPKNRPCRTVPKASQIHRKCIESAGYARKCQRHYASPKVEVVRAEKRSWKRKEGKAISLATVMGRSSSNGGLSILVGLTPASLRVTVKGLVGSLYSRHDYRCHRGSDRSQQQQES